MNCAQQSYVFFLQPQPTTITPDQLLVSAPLLETIGYLGVLDNQTFWIRLQDSQLYAYAVGNHTPAISPEQNTVSVHSIVDSVVFLKLGGHKSMLECRIDTIKKWAPSAYDQPHCWENDEYCAILPPQLVDFELDMATFVTV